MKYEELRFLSSNGTDTVVSSLWTPDSKPPIAILQIVHGMCEHMGRYKEFASHMVKNGFAVCGHDLIGHGRTAKTDDDLGFFAEKDGVYHLLEDVKKLNDIVRERYEGLPCFLFGHSMGSFITRKYVTKYSDGLSGFICCGTGGPMPILLLAIAYCKFQCSLKGKRARGYAVNKLVFGSAYKKPGRKSSSSKRSYSSHAWLSRDPNVWEAFSNDPKCNFVFTNGGFCDMLTLYRDVSTVAWARAFPDDLPLFLISGDKDPVGNKGSGVKVLHNRLRFMRVCDLTLKLYKGARHELLNETNKKEVYDDILKWILARI